MFDLVSVTGILYAYIEILSKILLNDNTYIYCLGIMFVRCGWICVCKIRLSLQFKLTLTSWSLTRYPTSLISIQGR